LTAEHYDSLETRDPEVRVREQFAQLQKQVAYAKTHSEAFARTLSHIDPQAITTREALAQLPVVRKSELADLQKQGRPFGGLAATRFGAMRRVFASPGGIYEPEGSARDYWRLARALFAAGFREGDLVHNCFAYHLTPAGSMLETGLHALGCTVFPGGTGQTEQQVAAIGDLRPTGYVGTPSFLRIVLERADDLVLDVSSITKALVSAEPFPATLRDAWKARGIDGYQVYATADVGSIAYETQARDGLVVDNPEGSDRMILHVEVCNVDSQLADAIVASIRDVTKLRGDVMFRAVDELPKDGKVIDDLRKLE
jgi:phenylacetate-CoA ligase